jgi:hypothetical protein
MKSTCVNRNNANNEPDFKTACVQLCRKFLAQIQKTKDVLAEEYSHLLEANEHLFHLAVNEAEALAWETEYPHLVFPDLAAEKAEALAAWQNRQQALQQTGHVLALAA